jgi:hypothetical protein
MGNEQRNNPRAISAFKLENVARWNQLADDSPSFGERYTLKEQLQKEKELESVLNRIPDLPGGLESLPDKERLEVWSPIRLLISQSLLNGNSRELKILFEGCKEAGEEFARRARTFDPSLSGHDIRQALRNLWVFNSLQYFLGRPVCLTPSSFAYSLLYPYTDNWLDGSRRSLKEKTAFSNWIASRLAGRRSPPRDHTSTMIDRLVAMIEDEYPRTTFPDVVWSLQAIHAAQYVSLQLLGSVGSAAGDLLGLTVEKGGASVLADGMLVEGGLKAYHQHSMFSFGVALQLVDDLQDFGEDGGMKASTPFVRAAQNGTLDRITNRLFQFVRSVASEMNACIVPGHEDLIPVIVQSCDLLIMESAVRYREWYSTEFLTGLEAHLPVRSSYLSLLRERLEKNTPS